MKKLTSILLSAALLLSLAACGGTSGEAGSSSAPTPEQAPSPAPSAPISAEPAPEATAPAENGKTLVVYYSATNRTEAVAQTIADTLGGSGWAGTPDTIAQLEPKANILEGLSISRNVIEDAHDQIVDWVRGLDI